MWQRKHWLIFLAVLTVALCFRISVAHWLANDNPDDGRVYAQIARDVLEQHVFSQDAEPPYEPTLIRTPGYPLFIAAIYSIFGHSNNGAVRISQGLLDAGTCVLVAVLAFIWQPDERRKLTTALIALGLAALNPFTTIYSATILPEVPTMFLAVAGCVSASLALQSPKSKHRILFWIGAGLLIGLAVLFRPDMGLVAAAIGLTLVVSAVRNFSAHWRTTAAMTVVFSLAFIVALLPWTIRNWRTFHLFQPLAPAHAEMPDEFIPHGYNRWLKTWLDDPQYIDPMEWELNVEPINIDDLPDSAFDSKEERDRVAALIDKYNHPQIVAAENSQPSPSPSPPTSPTPAANNQSPAASPSPNNLPSPNSSSNVNQQPSAENQNATDESDEDEDSETTEPEEPHGPVQMTPEIDAGFAQIAAERIARHRLRYYVLIPARRARALWFNTHSDFYPFEGTLLPLEDLDYDIHQQLWLPLFALLVGIHTIGGIAGAFVLWASRNLSARLWLLLTALIVFLRLAFLSTLENPEPRYVVEFFPFLAALGGIAVAYFFAGKRDDEITPAASESTTARAKNTGSSNRKRNRQA